MPAGIIAGFCNYLSGISQLNIPVFEGEIPRFDVDGDPIVIPGSFPVFKVEMTEGGLDRQWTQADPYADSGPMIFQVFDTTRAAVQTLLNQLEGLLCNSSNWEDILLPGGPADNPYYVVEVIWQTWTNVMMQGLRTQNSDYIYMGQVICKVTIHGAVTTRLP